jgi:hypothetical protein
MTRDGWKLHPQVLDWRKKAQAAMAEYNQIEERLGKIRKP